LTGEEVSQQGGGGVYFGPYQQGPLYDKGPGTGNELVERKKRIYGNCPIHGGSPGWNLSTIPVITNQNVDGDKMVICPICRTQGLLQKGSF